MKRLYYLTNSLESVSGISEDLHNQGIDDWHIHVLSRNEAGLYHRQVHSSNIFQENDVIHSGEIGAILGGAIGLLFVIFIEFWTPFGAPMPLPILILAAGVFTLFGTWSGGLAGVTRENYKIARFHDDLEKGKHLIMIDVSKRQEQTVRYHLEKYHSDAVMAGEDTPVIMPFGNRFWSIPRHN